MSCAIVAVGERGDTMLYNWELMTESQKIHAVETELKKIIRNATTKQDLVNMLRWLWDKFEVEQVEEVPLPATEEIKQSLEKLFCEGMLSKKIIRNDTSYGLTDKGVEYIEGLMGRNQNE